MAVVIRLARFGTKHSPKYRITVADSRKPVTGKFLEVLGIYNPSPKGKDKKVEMDLQKARDWMKKGAQASTRVLHVIKLAEKDAPSTSAVGSIAETVPLESSEASQA